MSSKTDSQQPAKRPRGRPRKQPGEPSKPASEAVIKAAQMGGAARWGGRGASITVRVNPDVAAALAEIPERDRRRVASDGVFAAVLAYKAK